MLTSPGIDWNISRKKTWQVEAYLHGKSLIPNGLPFIWFLYFWLDPKEPKDQGFPKMAENRRAFWQEETKVVTFSPYWIPMYKNLPCIASHHRRRFFSIFSLPVFLTPFLEGQSYFNCWSRLRGHTCPGQKNMRGPAAWADKKKKVNSLYWHH